MASASIAFEAPDNASGASPSKSRPIDLVHLANQTMGDKTLENEILLMFSRNARGALNEIATGSEAAVVATAHRLKGSAAAVGAFRVFVAAELVEANGSDAALRASLGAAVVEAENFILKLCR
jgi:HPt (histidine-containing phosphotransfer) domain-containing protein